MFSLLFLFFLFCNLQNQNFNRHFFGFYVLLIHIIFGILFCKNVFTKINCIISLCLVNKFSISIVNIKALIVNALALVSIVVFSIWSFAINKYWLNNNISCRYFPSAVITHNYASCTVCNDHICSYCGLAYCERKEIQNL